MRPLSREYLALHVARKLTAADLIVVMERLGDPSMGAWPQPLPVSDVWNAALALEHGLTLLAEDAHFSRVPGLKFIPIR